MQSLLKNTAAYKLLKAERDKERFGHAYLLTMDDGRNLRLAAKTFAKLFFGSDEGTRVSNLIDRETFSDCLFYPQTEKKFAVEDAERLGEECFLQPVEGDKKLFIIIDFAEANIPSQNKLLKLLEQPPEGVMFLLCATSVYPILLTVLSRVEKLEISPFSVESVAECLKRIYGTKYAQDDIALCAAASGGVVGTAQNMLEGGGYKTLLDDAFALATADPDKLPALVRRVGETKNKKGLLSLFRIVYRDALLCKTGNVESLLLRSEQARSTALANKRSAAALLSAQEYLTAAERELTFNAVFPQCIETFLAAVLEKDRQS
jgi:DNA polymerase-3 subunit delta'